MLIDWFTVGAQALNFLILVWLMKRFLYKPIQLAIDTREKRIAGQIADAETKRTEAQKEREEFQRKNEDFSQQRAALLITATREVQTERERLLAEARQAADAVSASRQQFLTNEALNLNQSISRRTQQEVFAISRKTLKDLASTSLEACVIEVFVQRLRGMEAAGKESLSQALKTATETAVVRSALELSDEQRAAIQNAINEIFRVEIRLRFETAPNLISGIELSANGQKVVWSIADYLASLEKGVAEMLNIQTKPAAVPVGESESFPTATHS
ncbi:MAG: synthase subcomplex subunit [Verrucomicrobiales bacterium]|nr:synthase subcomplex subunit [Verrucomicrobiales bacterium]